MLLRGFSLLGMMLCALVILFLFSWYPMWEFLNRSRIAAAGCGVFISFFGPCDPVELDAFLKMLS
jgi:hypothetical protein